MSPTLAEPKTGESSGDISRLRVVGARALSAAAGTLLTRPAWPDAPDPAPTPPPRFLSAERNTRYDVEMGTLSHELAVTHYTNFYEFTEKKDVFRHVQKFETRPWTVEVTGLVAQPHRWPYYEALTLAEAMNELTFATVGLYGKELTKQNGAPFRIIIPWKYGFKGPKSVVRIELTEKRPRTFWNDLYPREYGFEANVDPNVPHPRWSQAEERAADLSGTRPTLSYNGYGQWVAGLYT